MAELITFKDWFDPYNPQHVEWAREFLSNPLFDFETVVPENVVISNSYGIREHIHQVFATCWVLFKLEGVKNRVMTH